MKPPGTEAAGLPVAAYEDFTAELKPLLEQGPRPPCIPKLGLREGTEWSHDV